MYVLKRKGEGMRPSSINNLVVQELGDLECGIVFALVSL